MTNLNVRQAARGFDVLFVVVNLGIGMIGGYRLLFATNQPSRVLSALTLIFCATAVVIRWLDMRRSANLNAELYALRSTGLGSIALGLLALSGAAQSLSDSDRTDRLMGAVPVIFGVVLLLVGGLLVLQFRKRRP